MDAPSKEDKELLKTVLDSIGDAVKRSNERNSVSHERSAAAWERIAAALERIANKS